MVLPKRRGASHSYWQAAVWASAVVLGGILVAGGIFLGHQMAGQRSGAMMAQQGSQTPLIIVTPEQRREIAGAFALHESVAGPLSWYAADESNIRTATARNDEKSQQPIAVVLRLTPAQSKESDKAKTYVIVCRGNDEAALELPQSALAQSVRLRLISTAVNGRVSIQYAIAADGAGAGADESALAGRRHVGLGQTSLGQLALNDRLVNIDASAWVIRDQLKP
jgi:hypothetical protein